MTTEVDVEAANAAIAELTTHKDTYVFEEELLTAGRFVARYGCFADLFAEPDLSRAQFWVGERIAAWGLLGHWSVERADPRPQPPDSFEEHAKTCEVCDYLEGVAGLRMAFEYELCHECGLDLDAHDIAPDPLGKAHAWCTTQPQ